MPCLYWQTYKILIYEYAWSTVMNFCPRKNLEKRICHHFTCSFLDFILISSILNLYAIIFIWILRWMLYFTASLLLLKKFPRTLNPRLKFPQISLSTLYIISVCLLSDFLHLPKNISKSKVRFWNEFQLNLHNLLCLCSHKTDALSCGYIKDKIRNLSTFLNWIFKLELKVATYVLKRETTKIVSERFRGYFRPMSTFMNDVRG